MDSGTKRRMNSFNENSIYSLLTVDETKEIRPPRYVSRFRRSVWSEYRAGRGGDRTMGPARVSRPDPQNLMVKRAHEPVLVTKTKFHFPDEANRKPALPHRGELPLLGLKTTNNIMCLNSVHNLTSRPLPPARRFVDTRHGDLHPLGPSGLEPVFVHKKDFGEVPAYLTRRQEELQVAQDEYHRYVSDCFQQGSLQQLTEEEHSQLLRGLKSNYEDLQEVYRGMPAVVDTIGRQQRQQRLEGQMKQLERDIELLEKHKIIYVGN